MKKIIFTIFVTILACSTAVQEKTPVVQTAAPSPAPDLLSEFFSRCREDMGRASRVVIDEDIIKNLSHLHRMDSGGRKYYILERDAISHMLRSVTREIYTDFILINEAGTIIYTASNDSIFGKNVRRDLRTSVLARSMDESGDDMTVYDVTPSDSAGGAYCLYMSCRVHGGKSFPGIFILQLDTQQIARIFSKPTEVVGNDGKYRITEREKILQPYPRHETLALCRTLGPGEIKQFRDDRGEFTCRDFRYSGLSWFVITQGPF